MIDFFVHYITVLKYALKRKVTLRYPKQRNMRSDKFRGMHTFNKELCVKCKTCELTCYNHCINVDKDFEIDYTRCCFCGRCIEACPTKALKMTKQDVGCERSKSDLIYHFTGDKR